MSKQWLGNLYGFCLFWWVLFVCFYIISLDKDLLEQASNSGFFLLFIFFSNSGDVLHREISEKRL